MWLWLVLLSYGLAMWLVSPRARSFGEFFAARRADGREVRPAMLVASVVISWVFAKSITNAANLGYHDGMVGAVAYAGWYLSIPVAGFVIYLLRTRLHATSLSAFLVGRYGRAATGAFLLVVLLRLANEVWSNTAVVGTYFGPAGSGAYYAAALVFTALTLFYSLRGGLRSSILTDAVQLALGVFLLVLLLAFVVPKSGGVGGLITSGEWSLEGGVDLLIVAVIQSLSYPFHDPVLTDRAFITEPRAMLRGYLWAGLVAAAFIILFGLVGVYAREVGLDGAQDTPLRVAGAFGVAASFLMTVLMMVSAGSTLDSALSSFSKAAVIDLAGGQGEARLAISGRAVRWLATRDPVRVGRWAMVIAAVVGSVPLFTGAAIIQATTISGTMVLGLAPPFILGLWSRPGPLAFHLALWPGIALGVLFAAGALDSFAIGDGRHATLLGVNVYGTLIVFGGFVAGAFLRKAGASAKVALAALALGLLAPTLTSARARAADPAPASAPALTLNGQTMMRLTLKLDDPERPTAEVYNVRLLGKASLDAFRFLAEVRLRQTPLRSFSPSNIWLQQAYATWQTPIPELTVSGGLLYDVLGLPWDGSWFGNLPYLNGLKLDPDLNLEVAYKGHLADAVDLAAWLQLSPGEDGLNGTYATAAKLARLRLAPDPETVPGHREALAVRARVLASFKVGALTIAPGLSFEGAVIDRAATADLAAATGHQRVLGVDLSFTVAPVRLFGEVLREDTTGLLAEDLRRTYVLAGFEVDLLERPGPLLSKVTVGATWSYATYAPEDLEEHFVTARIHARVHPLIGLTAEYVRWQLSRASAPELDRFELIVHVYY